MVSLGGGAKDMRRAKASGRSAGGMRALIWALETPLLCSRYVLWGWKQAFSDTWGGLV